MTGFATSIEDTRRREFRRLLTYSGIAHLVLLLVFSALLLYGTLGGSRANRARDVLGVWTQAFAEGEVPAAFAGPPLAWDEQRPEEGLSWGFELVAAARALEGVGGQGRGRFLQGLSEDEDRAEGGQLGKLLAHRGLTPSG